MWFIVLPQCINEPQTQDHTGNIKYIDFHPCLCTKASRLRSAINYCSKAKYSHTIHYCTSNNNYQDNMSTKSVHVSTKGEENHELEYYLAQLLHNCDQYNLIYILFGYSRSSASTRSPRACNELPMSTRSSAKTNTS